MRMPMTIFTVIFSTASLLSGQGKIFSPDLSSIEDGAKWRIVNRQAVAFEDAGRKAVRLDEKPGDGIVWLNGVEFSEGAIEVDLKGRNIPQKSFIGLAFHGVDDTTYEAVYFRPFNFNAVEAVRRSHSVQYISHPAHTWYRLREEKPGVYENALDPALDPDGWFHVAIELSEHSVSVFVNGAEKPSLKVERLAGRRSGAVGLWVGNGSDGNFANLRIMPGIQDAAPILTPPPGPEPRINGPKVYGCRPGRPFLYRIPCTGERPVEFSARGLPSCLILDASSGIINGTAPARGEYKVELTARNGSGKSSRPFRIVSDDRLALTPPMGWNHWYAHYDRITDRLVREAADAMITSGMADAGYQYVNIDDCWMNAPKNADSLRVGPLRDAAGDLIPNRHFPDMRALTDYIHSRGLKTGIYTSPGPLTCGGFAGTYGHEAQDAKKFADWGFDFLKYDWCSYGEIAGSDTSLAAFQKPYRLMAGILAGLDRDMVLNLCQYGMKNVWEWGALVGGHSWRTAGDLGFELDRIFDVALANASHAAWNGPGSWNDPDYIQIGWIGSAKDYGRPEPCRLTPDEQYAFMSLWCLMAAPLFYSGDMNRLDAFTIGVLCNPEVIEVDQDPLGRCGRVVHLNAETFLMVKEMEDGSRAVGLFNRGLTPASVAVKWTDLGGLGLAGNCRVRDLWRQKDLGAFSGTFASAVPARGVVLVRIAP